MWVRDPNTPPPQSPQTGALTDPHSPLLFQWVRWYVQWVGHRARAAQHDNGAVPGAVGNRTEYLTKPPTRPHKRSHIGCRVPAMACTRNTGGGLLDTIVSAMYSHAMLLIPVYKCVIKSLHSSAAPPPPPAGPFVAGLIVCPVHSWCQRVLSCHCGAFAITPPLTPGWTPP